MHLAHLPDGDLVLRGDKIGISGVLLQLILVYFRHTDHLRVFPLRWIFLSKKRLLLLTKFLLHLRVLSFERLEVTGQSADSITLACIMLEKLGLCAIHVLRYLNHLMCPLVENFTSSLVK